MDITVKEQNNCCILGLIGRMDATTVASFEERCKEQFEKSYAKIIVDMTGLEYISSAGLRGILMMEKTSKAKNCSLVFFGLQPMVHEVFKISSFLSILKICSGLDEAINL